MYNIKIIVTRRSSIKDRERHFFSDIINVNNFDPGLLYVGRTAIDHDFIVYDIMSKTLTKQIVFTLFLLI